MSVLDKLPEVANAVAELETAAALTRLSEHSRLRAVHLAHSAGLSQREIHAHLEASQSTIHRMLRTLAVNPTLLEETPAEVIDRRAAGLITTEHMMAVLADWKFTFGRVPVIDGAATDAYVSGTWDQVRQAYFQRRLTKEEFGELMTLNKAGLEEAVRSE
ncbi:helix-turn-helix domain-containing protein (plasmid) [Rhodococcoides fascians]|uniref:helix-turn-helix domain-containing protein n=1 Tax=Rhodococcoides fascians TaxID=1828 RepID=UPI00389AFBB0